jgi:DNA polymerase-3 subunit alpha
MFPKAKETFDKYPQLFKAQRLEGNLRGFSVHAAGLVVSNSPLTDAVAVYTREDKKKGTTTSVISIDKHDADYLNVLKIDVLGLATMGMIRLALEEIHMRLEALYQIPIDDEETLRGFQENDVVGIFQFDGRAMRSVNQELKPDNFAEVCDVNALARPGPLHSGAAADYIMVKHGKKRAVHWPEPAGPIVDEVTLHTNFQIVYQEQILQLVRRLADFSWEESSKIRKLISKKQGEQALNAMQQRFMDGTAANGIDDATAIAIWKQIVTAGAYAFNAAHCVSYGMLAFWTMWLKRHHPQAFYAAALCKVPDDKKGKAKRGQLLRDAARKGLEIRPPDIRYSGPTWRSEDVAIRAGLMQVDGVGEKAAADLVAAREKHGDAATFTVAVAEDIRWKGAKYNNGSLRAMEVVAQNKDPFELNVLSDTLGKVRQQILDGDLDLPEPTHSSLDVPYEAKFERVVWLGVIRERNLKDLFELHMSRTGEQLDPATVKDPDLVNWTVMLGEDETDILTITIDRWKYPRMKEAIWGLRPGKDIVLVKGIKKRQYRRAIYVDQIWVLDPEDEDGNEED